MHPTAPDYVFNGELYGMKVHTHRKRYANKDPSQDHVMIRAFCRDPKSHDGYIYKHALITVAEWEKGEPNTFFHETVYFLKTQTLEEMNENKKLFYAVPAANGLMLPDHRIYDHASPPNYSAQTQGAHAPNAIERAMITLYEQQVIGGCIVNERFARKVHNDMHVMMHDPINVLLYGAIWDLLYSGQRLSIATLSQHLDSEYTSLKGIKEYAQALADAVDKRPKLYRQAHSNFHYGVFNRHAFQVKTYQINSDA